MDELISIEQCVNSDIKKIHKLISDTTVLHFCSENNNVSSEMIETSFANVCRRYGITEASLEDLYDESKHLPVENKYYRVLKNVIKVIWRTITIISDFVVKYVGKATDFALKHVNASTFLIRETKSFVKSKEYAPRELKIERKAVILKSEGKDKDAFSQEYIDEYKIYIDSTTKYFDDLDGYIEEIKTADLNNPDIVNRIVTGVSSVHEQYSRTWHDSKGGFNDRVKYYQDNFDHDHTVEEYTTRDEVLTRLNEFNKQIKNTIGLFLTLDERVRILNRRRDGLNKIAKRVPHNANTANIIGVMNYYSDSIGTVIKLYRGVMVLLQYNEQVLKYYCTEITNNGKN